jgi:RNA polymerase sigma-70 factor (ECF subfamily)
MIVTADPPIPAAPPVEEEVALVNQAQADPRAFGRLYDRYVKRVYGYLYSRTGDRSAAEDITAQTFLAAFEALPRYRPHRPFAAWIFTIAQNKARDHFRRRRRQVALDEAHQVPDAVDLLQRAVQTERSAAVVRCIAALPEEDQELIRLRYVAELSFADMGSLLGRREDTVKKALYRLLARLQDRLEADCE